MYPKCDLFPNRCVWISSNHVTFWVGKKNIRKKGCANGSKIWL